MSFIPYVVEQTSRGERSYDIFSRLLNDRIVLLSEEVNDTTARYIKPDVSTICVGMAASMGAFLLSSGAKGKRIALPNSEIMIHQPSGGSRGQCTDIQIQAEQILKIKQRLNRILADNTGKSIEEIERDCERDYFMSADEAQEYGLIDKVIVKR